MRSPTRTRHEDGSADVSLTLVWVESTVDSTAAGAHLRGTMTRLADPRFRLRVFTQGSEAPGWLPTQIGKLARISRVVGRALAAPRRGLLVARWSPFISVISRRWRRQGLPTLLFVQGNLDDLYESNPWTRRVPWITKAALQSIVDASHIITPSAGLSEWVAALRPNGAENVTVIPNGVDVALFRSKKRNVGQEAPYALFFGNMARWQGIDTLLAALEQPTWPADLEMWFIGDGQLAETVQQHPDGRVRHFGRLPKEEVARHVAGAELVLATRHADGASATGVSPFKIIEAAAAGTPAVVTEVPGQAELARDLGGSVVIPADDPIALAQAVADLHADPQLRDRLSAQASRAVERYDWAAAAPTVSDIVLSLVGLPSPRNVPGAGAVNDQERPG